MRTKRKIKNSVVEELSSAEAYDFPKYTTQIINLVNSNAQGTRATVVGQMSELIQEFDGKTLQEWIEWYTQQQPDAIENATNKIYEKFLEMREAMDKIDKDLVRDWVRDLVYTKTYCGLKFQDAIISFIAREVGKDWRPATPEEESRGIDGMIGDKPIQVKSITYKVESRLSEVIDIPIVYYDKKKDGINIEYDIDDFK